MKILQINSVCGYGSTGRNCTELAEALHAQGHACYIAYGQLTTDFAKSYKIGTVPENHLHNICSRLFGKQGYYSKSGTRKLIRYIETVQPDVIHLHNLHGNYLNIGILFDYLAKADKPVVWTLHDCWAFTGKCTHYSAVGCYKWQTSCSKCAQISKYPPSLFLDRSKQMFIDKGTWFRSIKNMTISPVSNWLTNEVRKSFLNKYPIVHISNWVDQSVFRPSSGGAKQEFGIDASKFVVLVVAAKWARGDSKLNDLLRLSQLVSSEMQIVVVGNVDESRCLPRCVVHIPYVHDTKKLAEVYAMADVYVHLSIEDTFGKVIAEALSCGTPAIVYNATACPELVADGCGYVVEKRDVEAVFRAICKVKADGKQRYTGPCIQHVQEKYDLARNTQKTIQLYKDVLSS